MASCSFAALHVKDIGLVIRSEAIVKCILADCIPTVQAATHVHVQCVGGGVAEPVSK